MQTHHIHVRRTARYCTIGGESGNGIRSVWYVLHGYRQLAERFAPHFASIATPTRLVVAPEALNRLYLDDDDGLKPHGPESPVGATWMTRHDRESEIDDYVAYLDDLDRTVAPDGYVRRVVLGFSQGAATAARWATLGRRNVDRLIIWGSPLPHDLPLAPHVDRLRSLEPVVVAGQRERTLTIDRAEAEVARLAQHEIPATLLTHPGGHSIDPAVLTQLAKQLDA